MNRLADNNPNFKHGLKKHPIYAAYFGMKTRCTNSNHKAYPNYGGRGIKVCDSWINSFDAFKNDMLSTWLPGLTLDRIDNNGNYEPSNCKWSTRSEQNKNRRKFKNSNLPKGISKIGNKYIARKWNGIKDVYFGSFLTMDEAINSLK